MIIDFRCRLPFLPTLQDDSIRRYAQVFGFNLTHSYEKRSIDLLFQEMEEAGITLAVVVGRKGSFKASHINISNEEINKYVAKYPDKFFGIAGIDCSDCREAIRETIKVVNDYGFKGISIEPSVGAIPLYVNDRRIYPLYEKCVELDTILVITLSSGLGPYIDYTKPELIDYIATDFSELKIVVAHAGWGYVDSMLAVAFKQPNVYLSPDQYLHYDMPGSERYVQAANTYLQDRMIFGTAYPHCGSLKWTVERARDIPFKNKEILDNYLYRNAAKLLKM